MLVTLPHRQAYGAHFTVCRMKCILAEVLGGNKNMPCAHCTAAGARRGWAPFWARAHIDSSHLTEDTPPPVDFRDAKLATGLAPLCLFRLSMTAAGLAGGQTDKEGAKENEAGRLEGDSRVGGR